MRPHHGGVEHLNQVGRLAHRGEGVEEGLEHASLAQAPESLPNRVPVAELGGERPPGYVMDAEVVQRFEEPAVIPAFVAPARAQRPEHLNHSVPVLVCHPRQHGRPPQTDQPGIRNPERRESPQQLTRPNPSTPPNTWGYSGGMPGPGTTSDWGS